MQETKLGMHPAKLGYAAFFLPVFTFHICWLVSMLQGVFTPCVPYWADCVSISHTGRHGFAYILFKIGIFPTAILLVMFWRSCGTWLISLECRPVESLPVLALVGSLALMAYTLFLGHAGSSFALVRRFGVVLFMFCTFVSQVLVSKALADHVALPVKKAGHSLITFSAITLGVAMLSLVLDALLGENYDRIENAFEWWLIMMLLTHLFFLVRCMATSKQINLQD